MSNAVGRVSYSEVARLYHNRLEQNYPNPFNPRTTIAFSLDSPAEVTLSIYDVAGRRIRDLVSEKRVPGAYKVEWDGLTDRGQPVASGVYFYKLVAGVFTDTKKMTVLK
jgi:flagellar hook assembly protein FlgD